MTQKMPRNELLHERRHKRKAGAHGGSKRPLVSTLMSIEDQLEPPTVPPTVPTLTNGLAEHTLTEWFEKMSRRHRDKDAERGTKDE
jgi:hypothetical protein